MNVKITTESACDLPQEILDRLDITTVRVYVILDGVSYRDVDDMNSYELFDAVEARDLAPTTSAPSVQDYLTTFQKYDPETTTIIHISTTSAHSVCYHNALKAAEECTNVHVIDSRNATSGLGILVMMAAEMAQNGKSAEEIIQEVNRTIPRIELSCILNTVSYVRRGGRISTLAAKGVELLNLKPCVEMVNGKLSIGKKYRGKLEKVLPNYIQDRLKGRNDLNLKRIFMTNTLSSKAFLQTLVDLIKSLQPFAEVLINDAGCTISTHAGPNALGIIFIRK